MKMAAALLGVALAACQGPARERAGLSGLSAVPLAQSRGQGVSQSYIYRDRQQRSGLVGASLHAGLFSVTAGGQVLTFAAGQYQQLAGFADPGGRQWLASFNLDRRSVDIFHRGAGGFALQQRIAAGGFIGDSLCFFHSARNRALYLFIQDGRGRAQQWLVQLPGHGAAPARLIRSINLPYNSKACAADHRRGWLYVAEEGTGIWRYGAEPEAAGTRQLVAAQPPFGELEADIAAIAVDADGALWALQGARLQHLRLRDNAFDSPLAVAATAALPAASAQTLAVHRRGGGGAGDSLALSFYDQSTDMIWRGQLQRSQRPLAPDLAAIAEVPARVETPPAVQAGDAMDDPAIWFNRRDPAQSRILGTNKRQGLYVYNLAGEQLQFLADGRLNNVDVRYGFRLDRGTVDLAAATRRDDNSLVVYAIDAGGRLDKLAQLPTALDQIYGVCMGKINDRFYAYVNDKDGRIVQYLLYRNADAVAGRVVRRLRLASQPEGCVVDDDTGRLFVGEESRGVWVTGAAADAPAEFAAVAAVGDYLHADVEGMALAQGPGGGAAKWLVVSSQGNDSYTVYAAEPPFAVIGRFRIGLNLQAGVDGASETDGLDVSSANFGPAFPGGLLVVQDGRNVMPGEPQNFKLVDWRDIMDLMRRQ